MCHIHWPARRAIVRCRGGALRPKQSRELNRCVCNWGMGRDQGGKSANRSVGRARKRARVATNPHRRHVFRCAPALPSTRQPAARCKTGVAPAMRAAGLALVLLAGVACAGEPAASRCPTAPWMLRDKRAGAHPPRSWRGRDARRGRRGVAPLPPPPPPRSTGRCCAACQALAAPEQRVGRLPAKHAQAGGCVAGRGSRFFASPCPPRVKHHPSFPSRSFHHRPSSRHRHRQQQRQRASPARCAPCDGTLGVSLPPQAGHSTCRVLAAPHSSSRTA